MQHNRYLSDHELVGFMATVRERDHPNQPRDLAIFALLANTGIRPGEALALTRSDLHVNVRPAWLSVARLKKRKTVPQIDDIEISDELAVALARFVDAQQAAPGDRVFRVGRRVLQRLFKRYARRAGLWSGHYLYVLRHTAATRMYVATRDITVVQAMLGHESPDTSCIYAHIPAELLAETVNTLPVFV